MPPALHIQLHPSRLPSAGALQRTLEGLRLGVSLLSGWPPSEASPLAWQVGGEPVQLRWVPAAANPPGDGADRPLCLCLSWPDEPRAQVAALALATALVQSADAEVRDPARGLLFCASALATALREVHAEHC